MWRCDAQRSATTPDELPEELHLEWTRAYPKLQPAWEDVVNQDRMPFDCCYEPIVAGDTLYFGSNRNDRVTALDTRTGEEKWRFYADAPIRFPPVVWKDRLFFTCDDGHLYCLDRNDGRLVRKFLAGPRGWKVLGNSRLTSTWPVRGGPVVRDGKVYFCAGIWPFMGIYLYAVDAETGETVWLNDGSGSTFREQPHGGATSFSGIGPQGALVATEDRLLVPGGRSVPACLDRETGEEKYFFLEGTPGIKRHLEGASHVAAGGRFYFNHRGIHTIMYDLKDGAFRYIWNETVFPVLDENTLYLSGKQVRAYDLGKIPDDGQPLKNFPPLWSKEVDATGALIKAGNRLYAGGKNLITALELRNDGPPAILWKKSLEGNVARLIAADDRLFAVTEDGRFYAFGPEEKTPHNWKPEGTSESDRPALVDTPKLNDLLDRMGETLALKKGYCLAFGLSDGRLIEAIARRLGLHVIGADPDPEKIDRLRRHFDEAGIYGTKISLQVGTPETVFAPPYLAVLAVTEDPESIGSKYPIASVFRSLRPYGGAFWLPYADEEQRLGLLAQFRAMELPGGRLRDDQNHLVVMRDGPLPGAGTWTHQNADIASTTKSNDQLVKLPLGLLWFGGNSHDDVLPRHAHGPSPQVLDGRLYIEGVDCLSARDVYTGKVLWKRRFNCLDTYNTYYTVSYEIDPLFQGYNQRHFPGANARGTNYVVTDDTVYFLVDDECHLLDPTTGETRDIWTLPKKSPKDDPPEWGFLGVYEDLLIAGEEFVPYSKLYGVKAKEKWPVYDRSASKKLLIMDRKTGEILWSRDSKLAFIHNGIIAGEDRLYLIDRLHPTILKGMARRGEKPKTKATLSAVNIRTGKTIWETDEEVFGTALAYDRPHDLLLLTGKSGGDMLNDEPNKQLAAYQGRNGEKVWHSKQRHGGPVMIHNETIYFNGYGGAQLLTGEPLMRHHALTGEILPWGFKRFHGCNSLMCAEHLMTFRSGSAGFYDLPTDGGTGNIGGFKSGCSANLIAADGVLNAPDYTRTCTCSYPNQTSLAMIHNPEVEYWTFNSYQTEVTGKKRVRRVGLNFGAPGDRRTETGTLWLDTPSLGGASPDIPVITNLDPSIRYFRHHQMQVEDAPIPWVAASGIEGAREIRVLLNGQGKQKLEHGIQNGADDAEELVDKKMALTKKKLTLVDLDGKAEQPQTVGLRFSNLPIPRGAKIVTAYLQFETEKRLIHKAEVEIQVEATNDAAPFGASEGNLTERATTDSVIPWEIRPWVKPNLSDLDQKSPNLAMLLEEIVARPGWNQGQAVAFLLHGKGHRTAKSFDLDPAKAPQLIVEYFPPKAEKKWHDQQYTVRLHFLEPDKTAKPGDRVFDVVLQDQTILKDFDIVGDAGRARCGVIKEFFHVPSPNLMTLRLIPRTQKRPILCGIEIVEE